MTRCGAAIEIVVPGTPIAKARHRSAWTPSGPRTYTPAKTVRFEERVALFAREAGVTPLEGPVGLDIRFTWPMKGQPRKREPRPEVWKYTLPDIDNALKAVMDGLQGVAYPNDGQVCSVWITKTHAAQGGVAQTVIRVVDLGGVERH